MKCGKLVSSEVPDSTVIRAFVECPECVEKHKSQVKIESPKEFRRIIGARVCNFEILTGEEACCNEESELYLSCIPKGDSHELKVRIHVDGNGDLCIYTD
jgi:hypothetical protein